MFNFNIFHKMNNIVSLLVLSLFGSCLLIPTKSVCFSNVTDVFIAQLTKSDGNLTKGSFSTLLSNFNIYRSNNSNCSLNSDLQELSKCVTQKCLSLDDLLRIYSIPEDNLYYKNDDVQTLAPALLYQSQKKQCQNKTKETLITQKKKRPSSAESWGFGFLFVTLINICSLIGALVLPFMKKTFYNQMLIFMVALAVGSLAGSGLLFLIPEALGLVSENDDMDYIWKGTTVMGGIYLFFITERILQFFLRWKKHHDGKEERDICESLMYEKQENDTDSVDRFLNESSNISSFKRKTPQTSSQKYRGSIGLVTVPSNTTLTECNSACSRRPLESTFNTDAISSTTEDTLETESKLNDHRGDMVISKIKHKEPIKTVAWMIIFGDGFHNFIDGLSIGAAFTDSILAGISISLAIICEELPHELGDFAILLNAGLTVKKALLFNFLSACMCYFGLIIGTILGENTSASEWIFGVAGGMFLYISLVDMMPEMNSAAECEEKIRTIGIFRIFILQNLGLICGFGILLLMAVYGGEIRFESH